MPGQEEEDQDQEFAFLDVHAHVKTCYFEIDNYYRLYRLYVYFIC